jgi:hypothetical protein
VHQRETLPFKRRKPKKLIISNAMVEVLRGFVKKRGKEKPRKPKQEKKRCALAFHASHPRSNLGVALINTGFID